MTRGAGNKVIVFAHHLNVLDGIQHTLGQAHHAIRINGSTSLESRKKAMDDFQQKPWVKLAILSITAAGVRHHLLIHVAKPCLPYQSSIGVELSRLCTHLLLRLHKHTAFQCTNS
jgi:hypothetical protein